MGDALRHATARRRRARAAGTVAGRRRPGRAARAVAGGDRGAGPALGGVLQRRLEKQQLVARYLFEHLFLAHLHFEGDPERRFFRLVRSRTPPGQPVDRIATRRPYDPPGVQRVYYRLVVDPETVVDKTHMPYALGEARMRRWHELFFEPSYSVAALPSYDPETAANPFIAFHALPVQARHRFLLDDAHYHIMTFIKGPVCRGQAALSVIEDHFWIVFTAPDSPAPARPSSWKPSAGTCACRWPRRARTRSWCAGASTPRARRRTCPRSPTSSSGSWGRRRSSTSPAVGRRREEPQRRADRVPQQRLGHRRHRAGGPAAQDQPGC